MMANKTESSIPKTAAQKKKWIQARKLVARQVGRYKEKEIPWGLVTHIYQNEEKAGKTIRKKDIRDTKAKMGSAVRKYKTNG